MVCHQFGANPLSEKNALLFLNGPFTGNKFRWNLIKNTTISMIQSKMLSAWCLPFCVSLSDPDSKIHGANMGPTWVLSAPGGPHVGLMNLAIRVAKSVVFMYFQCVTQVCQMIMGPISLMFCGHLGDRILLDGAALAISVSGLTTSWLSFPNYWPIVRGIHKRIHRRPTDSPTNDHWYGALMFHLSLGRTRSWFPGDAMTPMWHHYDVRLWPPEAFFSNMDWF